MAPLVDCHTHTTFSDGASSFEENLAAACAMGCAVLVCTDHLTLPESMDPICEMQVAEADLGPRRNAFERARMQATQLSDAPELVYGFECDWYQGCEDNVEKWSKGAVVRLGSVHWLGDPAHPDEATGWIDTLEDPCVWKALSPNEVWQRYVDTWCHACESPLAFDSMAHPDLAMRYIHEGYAPDCDLTPGWNQMATCAHDAGRRVELSTAGLRKTVDDYYPTAGLLERFAHAEVPLTVGSDAHRAEDICWGIREAYVHAMECGYRAIEVPHADGDWQRVPLD